LIIGVGVDIMKIQRMESAIQRSGEIFLNRIFTPSELKEAGQGKDYVAFLATRFAGKEAILKTIGTGWSSGVRLTEIEILNGKFGEPLVSFSGKFNEIISQLNGQILISLSYDTDYAVAIAILSKRDPL